MSSHRSLILSRILPGILLALVIGALSVTVSAATPKLEERMSEAQFNSFGLDKLTPEQLRGLNEWLGTNDTAMDDPDRKPVFYPDESKRVAVEANLLGKFSGWGGNTIFRLDNGQEWVQSESGSFTTGTIENARVTIKPKFMGSWLLTVKNCDGCRVSVRRSK